MDTSINTLEHCFNTNTSSTLPSHKPPAARDLQHLIQLLYEAFAGDEVDVDYVTELLESYKSNPRDWAKFAKFDRFKYTRNLVDEGNGKFDLMLLCWNPSLSSAIHDHTDAHCFMKVLDGRLEEVRYAWPEDEKFEENDADHDTMRVVSTNELENNSVCYMSDKLGVHRVANPSNSDPAVSLHLYCPPFSTCNIFDETTGRKSKAVVTFYSKFGQKIKYDIKK